MTSTTNPFDLTGKVAVVTGGAGIIGSRVSRGLATHGAAVAIVDLDGERAADVARTTANECGGRIVAVACDVASPRSVADAIERITDELGAIHVLHNNAATKGRDLAAFLAPFEDYALDVWREIMAVNVDGMFLVAQAVGRQMIAQGAGGSVIQTASIYGISAPDFRIYAGSNYRGQPITTPAVYAASKAAVVGLSKYLATYWAPHRIRVNTLVPGGVASGQNESFQKAYGARVPLGRMAEPDEMVGAVIFLASDAASYVTGQTLAVDGGWTAW